MRRRRSISQRAVDRAAPEGACARRGNVRGWRSGPNVSAPTLAVAQTVTPPPRRRRSAARRWPAGATTIKPLSKPDLQRLRRRSRNHRPLKRQEGRRNSMKIPQTGGCQCGKIRYEIIKAPRLIYTCHCTECQRLTSSAFSMAIVVADQAFRLTRAEPRLLRRTAENGRAVTQWVCPECGSWICGSATPNALRRVRVSTLDDTSWIQPTVHFWTRSKQPWIILPEGDQSFETQPPEEWVPTWRT